MKLHFKQYLPVICGYTSLKCRTIGRTISGAKGNEASTAHGPRGDGPVVRAVRYTACDIIKKAALNARDLAHRPAGSITRRQPPEILAVANEGVQVMNGILLLHMGRAPAILEVVAALAAHKEILDSPEVDPQVGVLMDEERAKHLALAPLLVTQAKKSLCRRAVMILGLVAKIDQPISIDANTGHLFGHTLRKSPEVQ